MNVVLYSMDAGKAALRRGMWRLPLLLSCLPMLLGGCGAHVYHIVQQGDTLYSVSFRYQRDYHDVAAWNGLQPPYALKAGQQLRVAPLRQPSHGERLAAALGPGGRPIANPAPASPARTMEAPARSEEAVTIPLESSRTAPPTSASAPSRALPGSSVATPPMIARVEPPPAATALKPPAAGAVPIWQWPVHRADARIEPARKGLEIRAARGEPVYAAADGRVVYGGTGIPHFGNLIIIKHDERFLSAYAHNERLLVTEGTQVRAGQQIAEMGDSGTGAQDVKLHFEIRLDGSPVDPMQYLPYRRGG